MNCALNCTTVSYVFCIRTTEKKYKNHLYVHLNLCIALALGLLVFIAGIENATSNEVRFNILYKCYCMYANL